MIRRLVGRSLADRQSSQKGLLARSFDRSFERDTRTCSFRATPWAWYREARGEVKMTFLARSKKMVVPCDTRSGSSGRLLSEQFHQSLQKQTHLLDRVVVSQ